MYNYKLDDNTCTKPHVHNGNIIPNTASNG